MVGHPADERLPAASVNDASTTSQSGAVGDGGGNCQHHQALLERPLRRHGVEPTFGVHPGYGGIETSRWARESHVDGKGISWMLGCNVEGRRQCQRRQGRNQHGDHNRVTTKHSLNATGLPGERPG